MKFGKKGLISLIAGGVFLTSIIAFSLIKGPRLIKKTKKDYGNLMIRAVEIWDNGEGDGGIHGPDGRLHYLIFDSKYDCPGDKKEYKNYLKHGILYGFCGPKNDEWLDGDTKNYSDFNIWKWKSENDKILFFVYESDPSKWGIFPIPFREHDALFCRLIERKDTLEDIPKKYSSRYKISKDVFEKFKKDPEMLRKIKNIYGKDLDNNLPAMSLFLKTEYE